jgi:ribosomal protein S18 acetylase RimI-like enzyme
MPHLDANVRIRAARLSDAPRLAALMRELGYETTSNEMRARLKSIVRDSRYSTLVAKIGKEVCGMIGTLTHKSHEHNDLSGKIVALVVSMKQRRSGIGRALIAAAEKDFARRNVTRVTLTTRFERDEAHQFYEAAGYTRTGLRFAKNLTPAERTPGKIISSGRGPGIVLRRERRSAVRSLERRPADRSDPRHSICRARI